MSGQPNSRSTMIRATVAVALVFIALGALALWTIRERLGPRADGLPKPGSEIYREMVSAFHAGTAALDVDAPERAKEFLARATKLVPEEPAAWANQGLLNIRLGDYERAREDLERARSLAPGNGAIEALLGLMESRQGHYDEAIAHWKRAVDLDPADLKSRFALVKEVERRAEAGDDAEALRLATELSDLRPENVVALLERARLATKSNDLADLMAAVARLEPLAPSWPARAREIYGELAEAAKANPRAAASRIVFLRNLLLPTLAFREALAEVETPVGVVGEPIEVFLRLAPPPPTASPPDESLTFAVEPLAETEAAVLIASPMTAEGPVVPLAADAKTVRRLDGVGGSTPFPGRDGVPPSPFGVLAVDWNSDYRMDLVLAGAGGLKILKQTEQGSFDDATDEAKLDADIRSADLFGVWAADIEMDGDLDLIVGVRKGPASVLRNNGDGTFSRVDVFAGAADLRDFAWADFDGDGDPDAALLDVAGKVRFFSNERAGVFKARPASEELSSVAALAIADMNNDGIIDLLAMLADGAVLRISDTDEGTAWDVAELVREPGALGDAARLLVADLDNNGALDLIGWGALDGWIRLADGQAGFRASAAPQGFIAMAAADLNADGRIDLAGLSDKGRPARALGKGTKDYHWQVIRPRGAKTFGDGRINSFGLGGEVEVRAGLLVQNQAITGPSLHFGLGETPKIDVARIVWPNGTTQAEFDTKANQELVAEQRLKGSCPFLYAHDGEAVRFVTDFIWRSPLGLRINAQDTAGASQTEDWVKIRGDQLAPVDGRYDVRITAELWETHYWDHVALMVVDHPEETEVFVDERFTRQPPALAVHPTGPLHPVARAWDDQGNDVTEIVAARDGRHLDHFDRGPYQGLARDHWVEVEIGEDVPRDRPLWLVASGWTHPTDSSINVAIGQGSGAKPQGLVLQVPDNDGGWKIGRDDLGFPAGKNKTILIDLDDLLTSAAPRRFRLRTNLEVFWDSLAVAEPAPDAEVKTQKLASETAELRHRGYSLMTQADESSPELPHYETLVAAKQQWRDLIGFYTRFGDVRELLEKTDDRYVIANAGDELALRFPAPAPPPPGWVRDFVMIGDGWNKDGDYNTGFSKTVLPLPSRDRPGYDGPLVDLEDDPVYRLHPEDWRKFHTRYVAPSEFQRGLRPRSGKLPGRETGSKP